jgi:hypothetical protein
MRTVTDAAVGSVVSEHLDADLVRGLGRKAPDIVLDVDAGRRVTFGSEAVEMRVSMTDLNRLDGGSGWIVEVGIRLYLAYFSISNTKQSIYTLGVERNRTAIHEWVKKADLQPGVAAPPNQIAVDETVIRVNDRRE